LDALFGRLSFHNLIIPYRNLYGDILGFVGRTNSTLEDQKKLKISKYKNTIFKKSNYLFGLYEARQSILDNDSVYIVEGQFDVIKAREHGITNIVAVGNSNITPYQMSLVLRYTKNIYLLFDNDEAGNLGRESSISKYGKYVDFMNLYIPEPYKDIDEYLKNKTDSKVEFILK
jgi:DNA primase